MNIILSGQDTNLVLPDGIELNMSLFDGWDDLTADQKKYALNLAKDPFNKTLVAMKSNVPMKTVSTWVKNDNNFKAVYHQILSLYKENLESIDYFDAQGSSKIRGKTITRLRQDIDGKEKKSGSKHIHFHGVSAKDIINGKLED